MAKKLPNKINEESLDAANLRYTIVDNGLRIIGYVTLPFTAITHAFAYGVGSGIYRDEKLIWTYTKSFDKKIKDTEITDRVSLLLAEAMKLETQYGTESS